MSVTTAPQAFVIEGGNALNGQIRASGNKNGALPILAACLLTDEPVTLTNVPRIRDVETMIELIAGTGASAEWTGTERGAHPRRRASPRMRSTRRSQRGSAPRSSSPARSSRASAGRACRRPAET